MKKIFLSFLLIFTSLFTFSQTWAPAGATWHYDYVNLWVSGYVEIQYTGDTNVSGKLCKILTKDMHYYDYMQEKYLNYHIGYEYTCLENGVVYYFRPCDSIGKVMVDNTGSITINTVPLKILFITPGPGSTWQFYSDTITERIGSFGYMFPNQNCVPDAFEGGPLRCYYDDSFGLYERGSAPSCDYITGIGTIRSDNQVRIYPLPAKSILTVEMTGNGNGIGIIRLSDLSGKQMKYFKTESQKFSFDISDLDDGIYFIAITGNSGLTLNRKVIKQ
jgi:hypothetical protein